MSKTFSQLAAELIARQAITTKLLQRDTERLAARHRLIEAAPAAMLALTEHLQRDTERLAARHWLLEFAAAAVIIIFSLAAAGLLLRA